MNGRKTNLKTVFISLISAGVLAGCSKAPDSIEVVMPDGVRSAYSVSGTVFGYSSINDLNALVADTNILENLPKQVAKDFSSNKRTDSFDVTFINEEKIKQLYDNLYESFGEIRTQELQRQQRSLDESIAKYNQVKADLLQFEEKTKSFFDQTALLTAAVEEAQAKVVAEEEKIKEIIGRLEKAVIDFTAEHNLYALNNKNLFSSYSYKEQKQGQCSKERNRITLDVVSEAGMCVYLHSNDDFLEKADLVSAMVKPFFVEYHKHDQILGEGVSYKNKEGTGLRGTLALAEENLKKTSRNLRDKYELNQYRDPKRELESKQENVSFYESSIAAKKETLAKIDENLSKTFHRNSSSERSIKELIVDATDKFTTEHASLVKPFDSDDLSAGRIQIKEVPSDVTFVSAVVRVNSPDLFSSRLVAVLIKGADLTKEDQLDDDVLRIRLNEDDVIRSRQLQDVPDNTLSIIKAAEDKLRAERSAEKSA